MKSLAFLLVPILLVGCGTTAPVTVKFPEAPSVLLEKCPPLKTIEKDDVSIIDITKNVTVNYTSYYECGIKVENWIEWYNDQKKIFEKIKR